MSWDKLERERKSISFLLYFWSSKSLLLLLFRNLLQSSSLSLFSRELPSFFGLEMSFSFCLSFCLSLSLISTHVTSPGVMRDDDSPSGWSLCFPLPWPLPLFLSVILNTMSVWHCLVMSSPSSLFSLSSHCPSIILSSLNFFCSLFLPHNLSFNGCFFLLLLLYPCTSCVLSVEFKLPDSEIFVLYLYDWMFFMSSSLPHSLVPLVYYSLSLSFFLSLSLFFGFIPFVWFWKSIICFPSRPSLISRIFHQKRHHKNRHLSLSKGVGGDFTVQFQLKEKF